MPLGTEVGLGQDHTVLDENPALPPKKGAERPRQFSAHFSKWSNGWMHHDATWYVVGLIPGDFALNGDPAPSPKKGGSPNFRPTSIVVPNGCMDQDATWYRGRPPLFVFSYLSLFLLLSCFNLVMRSVYDS